MGTTDSRLERKYWHQLHNIQSWADKEAEKTLKAEAYSTKKTATYYMAFPFGYCICSGRCPSCF